MAAVTYCRNSCRRTGENSKDNNGCAYVFCKITGQMCVAQRWCSEKQKHIISERAGKICKKFEG